METGFELLAYAAAAFGTGYVIRSFVMLIVAIKNGHHRGRHFK